MKFSADPLGVLADELGVGHLELQLAADGDGLQVLRAHHRAHARSAGGVLEVVDDAGVADQVLAARADLRGPDALVAKLRADRLLGLERVQAPEVRGVAQLGLAVVDPEVDRLRRLALEDDRVEAGVLELGAEEAADVALAVAAGQRRLRADAAAPAARRTGRR